MGLYGDSNIFWRTGNCENTLSIAEIDVLDFSRQNVPIDSISVSSQANQQNLQFLCNRVFFKNDPSLIWTSPFNSKSSIPFEITITTSSRNTLSGIQIWPNTLDHSLNPRHIFVFVDGRLSYKGEIRAQFSDLVLFKTDITPENNFVPTNQISRSTLSDPFGKLPYPVFQEFIFEIVSGYSSQFVGFSKIVMFDLNGKEINIIRSSKVEIEKCVPKMPNVRLFIDPEDENDQPWCAIYSPGARIKISFHAPIPISAVFLVNFIFQNQRANLGIDHFKIYSSDKLIFCGKLTKRIPGEPISQDKKGCKLVFFTTQKNLNQEVLKATTVVEKPPEPEKIDVFAEMDKDISVDNLSENNFNNILEDDDDEF